MALRKPYRVSRLAKSDISAIYSYTVRTWSGEQENKYQALIMEALNQLADGSRIGRAAAIEGYLSLRVGSHSIFYRVVDSIILIDRVLHQAMDVERHLNP